MSALKERKNQYKKQMSDFEKMLAIEHLPSVGSTSVSLGAKGHQNSTGSGTGNAKTSSKAVKIKRIKGRKSAKELISNEQTD